MQIKSEQIKSENLAYWYLRLNGFLTIPNFIVHPEKGNLQRTDIDIIGLRFPFREELEGMMDDKAFSDYSDKPVIVITEVKIGRCVLNGSWRDPQKKNMESVLQAVGAFKKETIEEVAENLYKKGVYDGNQYKVVLVCIGKDVSQEISAKYSAVPQITWRQVSNFIYSRFKSFERQKISHGQWDNVGTKLWTCMEKSKHEDDFHTKLIKLVI